MSPGRAPAAPKATAPDHQCVYATCGTAEAIGYGHAPAAGAGTKGTGAGPIGAPPPARRAKESGWPRMRWAGTVHGAW
ncbi:hypothetical protein GCM10010363_47710 [Streptomyces omiyaensis]|uniref:hypothetical protein n=1 Tax=Streptomyces omiyaensis TaxID=68247 RepID=UPI001671971B|nr:hypothetical protein [Streptomyces omiyaensis]GGY60667.1 hypothetical protein GCM10010363_47710 [Streptomyces omiyaensis]